MKLLRIALSFAFFASFNTGIIQGQATPTPTTASYSQQDLMFIQKAFTAVVMSIQQIDQIIGDLALLISKHQIKDLKSPDHFLRILKEDRELLSAFMQVAASAETPEMQLQLTLSLLQICESFLPHLEKALKQNLENIEPFDPSVIASMAKRRIDTNAITPKHIEAMLKKMYERINHLKEKAGNAGLTKSNLFWRSVDKNVVTPWNRYHGPAVFKSLGGAALLSGYIIMKYGKNIDNSVIKTIHTYLTNKFGILLDRNGQGRLVESGQLDLAGSRLDSAGNKIDDSFVSPEQTTLFSLLDFAWNDISSGHAPLALLGSGALWGFYTTTWKESISPWINQKITVKWNEMRGGALLNAETPGLTSMDPKVNFDHMMGLEEVKESFKTILEYLDDPEKFMRSGSQPETGWILTGPTRTGKSFSFECLCGEIVRMQARKGMTPNFKFLKIGIEEIAKYGIEFLLDFAKSNAPMIIFIDEIDLLGLQRVGDNKLLHSFLTALQNTRTDDPTKVVMVMAATNSPETLDKALRQYGRLGKEIRFEYPGFEYRKRYLIKELSSMALNPHSFDIDSIVARTDGKSYEDLKAIIRTAMTRAWTTGKPLSQQFMEEAIDTEIYKIIMHDRKSLPENETRILAAHFAGKALAMSLLNTHEKLDKVTIKAVMTELQEVTAWHNFGGPKDKKDIQQKIVHGKLFTKIVRDTIALKSEEEIINDVKVLLAGFIAEEIILGSCGMQCHPEDSNKAYSIIDQFVFRGIDPNQLSKKVREQLRDKAYGLLTQYRIELKQLLEEHKEELIALTQELTEKRIMSDKQVKAVVETLKK